MKYKILKLLFSDAQISPATTEIIKSYILHYRNGSIRIVFDMPLKRVRKEVWSLLPGKKKVPTSGGPVPRQIVSSKTPKPSENRSCLTVLKASSQSLALSPKLQVKFVPELKSIVDMPPPGKKKLQETFIVSKHGRSKPPTAVSQRNSIAKVTKKDKESPAVFEARTGLKASSLTILNTTASEDCIRKTSQSIPMKCMLKMEKAKSVESDAKQHLNKENLKGNIRNSISEDSENENEDDFDKKFRNDYHFVVAKSVVRRRIGFNIDKTSNLSGFRKKMMRVLEQADIMKLRSALDGDSVSVPKHFKLPEEDLKPPSVNGNVLDPCRTEQVSPLDLDSNGNSPNISLDENDVKPLEERPDNMPLISGMMESPDKVLDKEVCQKIKPTTSVKRKKLKQMLEEKFYSSRTPPLPKKKFKKMFKIPKQKVCIPKWIRNGKLWQWALTVDDNGQFSM